VPELPEVETIVLDLKNASPKILGEKFLDVWTDFPRMVKKPKSFEEFKKEIREKKIEKIWRRGKNIVFDLSEGKSLLVHQKLTGHLLYGKWKREKGKWVSSIKGPLSEDPMNRFLHLIFFLENGWQLALSDLRKFAKVELWPKDLLKAELEKLGPEPLSKDFTFERFKETVLKRKKGKIKAVLMDQTVIAGIGNIYSDEALWRAKIHPLKPVEKISEEGLKRIYQAIKKILPKAIELGGESFSDFRRLNGEKGKSEEIIKVYRKEGKPCPICRGKIKRIKLGGRSAYFCPSCQKP
jgi:formamidopyrimidine-DNA glycosylase